MPTLKLALPITPVPKSGSNFPTMPNPISGHWAALFTKCASYVLPSEEVTCRIYTSAWPGAGSIASATKFTPSNFQTSSTFAWGWTQRNENHADRFCSSIGWSPNSNTTIFRTKIATLLRVQLMTLTKSRFNSVWSSPNRFGHYAQLHSPPVYLPRLTGTKIVPMDPAATLPTNWMLFYPIPITPQKGCSESTGVNI